jgi:hypothetical protein
MRKRLVHLVVVSAILAGCSTPDAPEIETKMERWLGIDVPSDFRVLNSEYSFAIGDDVWTVDIEYSPGAFAELVKGLDLSQWTKLEGGHQLVLEKETTGIGIEFFSMTIPSDGGRVLHIQYGSD